MTEPIRKKNVHAVALAKLGASKGGLARAAKLSPSERSELARKAVNSRWTRHREMQAKGRIKKEAKP